MYQPKRILAPIDFSASSLEALDTAASIASREDADLLLFYAVPVVTRLPENVSIFHEGEYEQQLIKDAETRLKDLADKVAQKGLKAHSAVGLANDAAMEIVRTAEKEKIDLIVISTHGMTGWRRLPFGSVSDKVVRTADCPVLVLRSAGASSGDAQSQSAASAAGH